MTVLKQKRIEFINDCGCIVDENELRSAILWYQNAPTVSKKHIYMYGRYPAVSIYNEKIHIHKLLMMYWNNTVSFDNLVCVHHLDGNKLNNLKKNLTLISKTEHASMHNKGKQLSEKHIQNIIAYNHTRKGIKKGIRKKNVSYQKIWEYYQQGYSINKISKALNYEWGQVKLRLQEIFENPELLKN